MQTCVLEQRRRINPDWKIGEVGYFIDSNVIIEVADHIAVETPTRMHAHAG